MADHTPSPPQDTFSTIAEGYGGAQQTLARLGFLPGAMPGSFSPSDRNGTAVQFPTPAPPRFPTVVSTTLPFPSAVPQFAGAMPPQPPSVLPPMFSTPQPTFTQGMPTANYAPQAPSYAPAMAPQAAPYPFGVPTAAPNWTRAFTQPMQGFGHPGAAFGGGSLFSDAVQAGYVPRPMFMEGPGVGVNTMQQRAGAGLRMNQRFEDWGASAISGASIGIGALGGAAALGIGGATLGGIASAAGLIAAPMMAASAWTGAYQDERAGTRAVQNVFSGMSMGPMMSPLGQGINPIAARQIQNRFKESTHGGDFTSGDMFSTMSMAQESGLMRGHTNSVDQVVTRVKELAKVTKSIMDLGQGITQQDAIELQAIASNMGIGTSQFAGQGIGKKLVTAARATGQTVQDVMSGVGASGASLFAQAGMNAGSGMMVGVHTAGVSAGMVNSGMFSPRELSALGGESGIQNTMAQGIARFQAQNAGNMMRGMLTGPDALHAMQTGTLNMADASKQGSAIFKDQNLTKQQRKLAAQFFDEAAPDMLSDMQSKMTPERMQAMQIAQAASLMRDSKGTMTANTAFTKVTGSEEGAKVLMKLMEHPEILRAQSAQASLVRREEVNRGAAEWDTSQGFMTRWGNSARSSINSLKKEVGIGSTADWAAGRDFMQESVGAGIDPSRHRRRYKNIVNNNKLIDDITVGGMSLDTVLDAQPRTPAGMTRRQVSGRDTSFAVDALTNIGLDVGDQGNLDWAVSDSSAQYAREQRQKRMQTLFDDQQGTVFIMDEAAKYQASPEKGIQFLGALSARGGTEGNVGRVITDLASTLTSEVIRDPENIGKTLGDSRVNARLDAALAASGHSLPASKLATARAELRAATSAHLGTAGSDLGTTEDVNAVNKAMKGAQDVRNADKGYLDADQAAEINAQDVTHGRRGKFMTQYTMDQHTLMSTDPTDNKNTERELTEFADLAAGAGLDDPTAMKLLISTGGSVKELLAKAGSNDASVTDAQRIAASKIARLDRTKNAALFSGAEKMRERMKKAAQGAAPGEVGAEDRAFGDFADSIVGIVQGAKIGGANKAATDLFEKAGLLGAGVTAGAIDAREANSRIQGAVASSSATSGRMLATEVLGAGAVKGASWDRTEESAWSNIVLQKQHGASEADVKALVNKIMKDRLVKAQSADSSGDSGGPGGDSAEDVSVTLLQEMQKTNKELFDSLKTLTTSSDATVDRMTKFIAAVDQRLYMGGL